MAPSHAQALLLGAAGGCALAAAAPHLLRLLRRSLGGAPAEARDGGEVLVGVLGGLGPAASALFAQLVVDEGEKGAKKDSDHPRMLMYCNPSLPNSRAAALGEGPSPRPGMADSFRSLMAAGASHVCVVCNTAHAFARDAAEDAGAQFLDMLEITAEHVVRKLSGEARAGGALKVGLLSTDGTIKLGLYQEAIREAAQRQLGDAGAVEVLVPDALDITQNCILRIKGNDYHNEEVPRLLEAEAAALVAKGAQVIVTGCTELPVVFNEKNFPAFEVPIVNPMEILAKVLVDMTLGR